MKKEQMIEIMNNHQMFYQTGYRHGYEYAKVIERQKSRVRVQTFFVFGMTIGALIGVIMFELVV